MKFDKIDTLSSVLTRMRRLSHDSDFGSRSKSSRKMLEDEFEQLKAEINNIAANAEFNGVSLLSEERIKITSTIVSRSYIKQVEEFSSSLEEYINNIHFKND